MLTIPHPPSTALNNEADGSDELGNRDKGKR